MSPFHPEAMQRGAVDSGDLTALGNLLRRCLGARLPRRFGKLARTFLLIALLNIPFHPIGSLIHAAGSSRELVYPVQSAAVETTRRHSLSNHERGFGVARRRGSRRATDSDDVERAPIPALLTPIGPFCPFHSDACSGDSPFGQEVTELVTSRMPRLMGELRELQSSVQTKNIAELLANRERISVLAADLTQAEEDFRVLITRMRMAADFQSREYYKIAVAWTAREGESLESMGRMMRYSADSMRALSSGVPPLSPPPGYDPMKLMNLWVRQGSAAGLSVVATMAVTANGVDCLPFTGNEAAFESETVRAEYEVLCRDHKNIIKLGEQFGSFDPLGQIAFLDALQVIEERWDVFFTRFQLLGQLDPGFSAQTSMFLKSLGMNAAAFRTLLHEAHTLLRNDAENARDKGPGG